MGLTLAYTSALHAMRLLRSREQNVKEMDRTGLAHPSPAKGRRWSVGEFASDTWVWQGVSVREPLHVMVPRQEERIWMKGITCHVCTRDLPAGSIVWLDERASMPSPEFLFLQMARYMSLPALVMLGYELCGHFSRCANNPIDGPITDQLFMATSVEELKDYVRISDTAWQTRKARKALELICDHAASAMEAVLATMYALPTEELGYSMGPLTLNQRVDLYGNARNRVRYPDIMFSFAPIGINYDGEAHLDLNGLLQVASEFEHAHGEEREKAKLALDRKRDALRAKVVDDHARNRQLAASGRSVFPAMKENVYSKGSLDQFTRDILRAAREIYGVETAEYEKALNDSALCEERYELLTSMLPFRGRRTGKRPLI